MSSSERVICRSDHDYLGYPLAFYWQGQRLEVSQLLVENHTPTGYTFRVRTGESDIFELSYEPSTDQWSVSHL